MGTILSSSKYFLLANFDIASIWTFKFVTFRAYKDHTCPRARLFRGAIYEQALSWRAQ